MKKDADILIFFIIGVSLGLCIGACITQGQHEDFKQEAIENNAAEYNSKTGEFQWIKTNKKGESK